MSLARDRPLSLQMEPPNTKTTWLNRTVLGVGLTSLFSDWSHETATAILPAFLAIIGAGPAWLGAIEGISDGLSSFAKLTAGHFTDRLQKRKPLVLAGYAITALATASFAFATSAYEILFGRVLAWLGRGVRSPSKKAILAADVPPGAYGRAFGFERLMDTVGAIAGPLTALWLLSVTAHSYRKVFLYTLIPGLLAVLIFAMLVRERYGLKSASADIEGASLVAEPGAATACARGMAICIATECR